MSLKNKTVGIYTLGCKVNQYESEAIAEAFEKEGAKVLSPTQICDIYIINTCTVTAESDRKARQFIRRAIHKSPTAYILVTGCLSQTRPEHVAAIPGVDYICGNAQKLSVVGAAVALCERKSKNAMPEINASAPDSHGFEEMHITHFDRTRAYVKIEDGCENRCTYCIIPTARGSVRSKSPDDVLKEVRDLAAGGCCEVVLTGIETASYGRDLDDYTLSDLLCAVDRIEGIRRVRLGSLDPSLIKQDFVDRIASLSHLAPHFYLSMQSGSDRILAKMKRKYNRRMALEGMERLRAAIPDVQFSTDMIVGFPGETEEDFADSVSFVKEAKFLSVHVFPYSKRAGTPAATMPDQVPEEIKHTRVKILSEIADETRNAILDGMEGEVREVLFETDREGYSIGHTPDFIEVIANTPHPLDGTCLPVRILSREGERVRGEILIPDCSFTKEG